MLINAIGQQRVYFRGTKTPFGATHLNSREMYGYQGLPKIAQSPCTDTFICNVNVVSKLKHDNISFGYEFALKEAKDIPCAYCGKDVLGGKELDEITHLRGQALVQRLEKFASQDRSAMTSQNRKALGIVINEALNHPDKTGSELLPIIYTRARNRMLIKQNSIYSKIERLAHTAGSDELLDYIEVVKEQDVILKPSIPIDELKDFLTNKIHIEFRKDVVRNVEKILKANPTENNDEFLEQIMEKVHALPSSKNDPDAFLVKFISKAIRKDPKIENELVPLSANAAKLFYSTLLFPFISSAEHIQPYSKGGDSKYTNYLVTHSHCNKDRGNTNWAMFMLKLPERFDHVIESLEYIISSPDAKKSAQGMHLDDYVKKVRCQLQMQLVAREGNPCVKNFLDRLDSIKIEPFEIKDESIKQYVRDFLRDGLNAQNETKQGVLLERALREATGAYIESRRSTFDGIISHFDDTEREIALKEFFINERERDPVLRKKYFKYSELANILDEANEMRHAMHFDARLRSHMEARGFYIASGEVRAWARKVKFVRKKSAYCLKVLLDARISRYKYDIDIIKSLVKD